MQLSEKPKTFSEFLLHFWNLHYILNILKKRMNLVAQVFVNLLTPKDALT